MSVVDFSEPAEQPDLLFAARHPGALLEHLREGFVVVAALENVAEILGGTSVTRVLTKDLLVDVAGASQIVQLFLQDLGALRFEVAGHGRRRDLGAPGQRDTELTPLLGLAVDFDQAGQGFVVCRIAIEDLLQTAERQIGA